MDIQDLQEKLEVREEELNWILLEWALSRRHMYEDNVIFDRDPTENAPYTVVEGFDGIGKDVNAVNDIASEKTWWVMYGYMEALRDMVADLDEVQAGGE